MEDIRFDQIGYVVNAGDSVGTALGDIRPGVITLRGEGALEYAGICAGEEIPFGHKFALRDMPEGALVVKYGAVIATAARDIKRGEHVHLHNVRSNFDSRAATFDTVTADSTDMEYKLY